jgi:hypothetical protein
MLGLCVNGFLDCGPDAPKVTRPQNSVTAAPGSLARANRPVAAKPARPHRIDH